MAIAGNDTVSAAGVVADVSAQEQLNRTIRQRDKVSRQLLQALPKAIYTTDARGRITFFNEAAVDFAGRPPALGDEWCVTWKLFHLDGTPMPHNQCPMAIAIREARPVYGEEAIAERPDGSRITFAAYPTPLFDDDGTMIGAVNMLVDISEQRQTEQALQELNNRLEQRVLERTRVAEATFMQLHRSERNFALLVGSVVDYAIFMLDPQGMVTSWNAGAERIKGYSAEEIIGTHFSRFYTPEDCARGMPATVLDTARREGRYNAEGWRVRKDGSRFWASVVIDPIIDHGALVGFAKVTRDVTERMEAEAALVESERLARGVIDTALDGFVQLDEGGLIVQWNPRAEALFGWSRDEAVGQSLSVLVGGDGDREHFKESLQPTVQVGSREADWRIEMVNREGRKIPVELSVSSLFLDGGHRTNIFIRDLSEKILIEAQLRQAQKMEAVGQLTGGLAHDFNNLLQGIIGSLELIQLRVDAGKTGDVARFVGGALNSANRAAAMTHRLLAFSRRQPLDPRPVLANPLMLSMSDLLQQTLGEQIVLEFDLATDLWPTLCDPNQLENAVLNLSINARDAMPEGGRLLVRSRNVSADEVKINQWHEVTDERYICIEVADSGTGMSAEVIEHAFEPFFTTKALGQGTGLGLSMVYGFARQSNGYCDIHSETDRGTTVALYLPRLPEAADAEDEQTLSPEPAASGKGEIVLVVEDEDVVRHIVVEVLHQLGYIALEATDAETGLAALRSDEAIHLLISDIGLPGLNGRVLANTARDLRPELKILLMTGYASDASAPEAFAAGMELITKPFTVEALANRLRKMLGEAAPEPPQISHDPMA